MSKRISLAMFEAGEKARMETEIASLRQQLEQEKHKREFAEHERDGFIEQLEQAQAREVELLTICQSIQRDLLLRAEPDWDGSGQQVVNLSAGFWDELNRVIGKYDDTACKSFDALILRKQAEAVEESQKLSGKQFPVSRNGVLNAVWDYAQHLRQQADQLDAEQAGGSQCQ